MKHIAKLCAVTALIAPGIALAPEDTIKIGAIAAVTGPINFSEVSNATKAVFDRVNAAGGIDGRMIEYVIEDDRTDPNVAAQAARRLLDQTGVVGLAGSASLLECAVNQNLYKQRGFISVTGLGVDPACFESPAFAPMNTGPYVGAAITLLYAAQTLGHKDLCMTSLSLPIQNAGWDWVRRVLKEETGSDLKFFTNSLQPTDDVTPYVLQSREQGCDAMLATLVEPGIIAWLQAADTQGVDDVQWLFLTSGYTDGVANAVGEMGDGAIFNVEFEPYLADVPALEDWRDLMIAAELPQSSFTQSGYLAGQTMVAALESIEGEITRETVNAALLALDLDTPLAGKPIRISDQAPNTPNTTNKFVTLEGGAWSLLTEEWVPLPGTN